MVGSVRRVLGKLTWAQRFLIGSLVILVLGMVGVGQWLARQIEESIVQRTATTTTLYVDSLIAPPLQTLATADSLTADNIDRLNWLVTDTPLGQQLVLIRIWDPTGRIVYSNIPSLIGEQHQVYSGTQWALDGWVQADIGDIRNTQGLPPDAPTQHLLKVWSPVRNRGTEEVIAAAEFYYRTDELQSDVTSRQQRSWMVVGGATAFIYLLFAAFIQRASNTINRQQRDLGDQVSRLTDLLRQNDELHQRVRGAAARTTALNERFLRRLSAELHDGPAQDISLALLQLDHVYARTSGNGHNDGRKVGGSEGREHEANGSQTSASADSFPSPPTLRPSDPPTNGNGRTVQDLDLIQSSLRRALQEVRATSTGLLLPQLGNLSLAQTIEHVARAHRRSTGSTVEIDLVDLPEQAPLVTKIAIYRVIQEALNNGWRHAGGAGQSITVAPTNGHLRIEVSDSGAGFDTAAVGDSEEHLGLLGMRERVESLGGKFSIHSAPDRGTTVAAILPVRPMGGQDG